MSQSQYQRKSHSRPDEPPEGTPERKLESQTAQALIDPYQVLGLTRQASADDIKKAYFAKVREFPPERDAVMFKQVRAAYDALRTPEARAATDLFLLHPPVPYEPYKRPPPFRLNMDALDWQVLVSAYSDLGRVDFEDDFRQIDV